MEVKTLNSIDANHFFFGGKIETTIQDRIRFFDFRSACPLGDGMEFYTFLLDNNKIIGMAHVGYYSLNAVNENNWSISFLSIDKNYRYNGYSKLIVEEIFKQAQERKLEISTSTYTVLGKEHLQKQFNSISKKYGVKFYDKPDDWGLIDSENMYVIIDGKKLHKNEL
jgi:GNAT superfamily N-acetyltransferase